jgi:hypothetical protein
MKHISTCELIIDQLVGFLKVEPAHPAGFKSSTWHGCLHFLRFISGFNDAMLLVVGNDPVNSRTSVMTS